jgi:hypothetical protein
MTAAGAYELADTIVTHELGHPAETTKVVGVAIIEYDAVFTEPKTLAKS